MHTLHIKLILRFVLGLFVPTVAAMAQSLPADHFAAYSFPVDGFEAAFPSKPLEFRMNTLSGYFNSYQALVVNPMAQYSVFVNHAQQRVFSDSAIDAYLQAHLRGLMLPVENAVLKKKERVQFQGYAALEYEYALTIDGLPAMNRGVIFIVDGDHMRLSQLYVPDDRSAEINYHRFTSSFRLGAIDAPLSDKRYDNRVRGISLSLPDGWTEDKGKVEPVLAIFSDRSGNSVTLMDTSNQPYRCDQYRAELQLLQGIQSSGEIVVGGKTVTWLKSTGVNPVAKVSMTSVHYCFPSTRGAVILIGASSKELFFRYEKIFSKVARSSSVRN